MLEPYFLEGAAYQFHRVPKSDGSPDWDLASIVSPEAAVLFALDTAYVPDPSEQVFKFGSPRKVQFSFNLPEWLREPSEVFRVDADGVHDVLWKSTRKGVDVTDLCSRDAIYIACKNPKVRDEIKLRRQNAIEKENKNSVEIASLEAILKGSREK